MPDKQARQSSIGRASISEGAEAEKHQHGENPCVGEPTPMRGGATGSTCSICNHPAATVAENNVSNTPDQGTSETTTRVEEDEAGGCHGRILRDDREDHHTRGMIGGAPGDARLLQAHAGAHDAH